MSGQAKHSHVRAQQRHREQVARAIVRAAVRFSPRLPSERDARSKAVANVLDGLGFNVHLAREYAERLMAMGSEYEVFETWCRDRGRESVDRQPRCEACDGRGSWNEEDDVAGYTVTCRPCDGTGVEQWPGRLAREYGTTRCEPCEGRGRVVCPGCLGRVSEGDRTHDRCQDCGGSARARCLTCRGKGHTPKPGLHRSAASGGMHARLGRRILAALEGQPSECKVCNIAGTPLAAVVLATADGGQVRARPGQCVAFVTKDGLAVVGRDGKPRRAIIGEAVVTTCNACRGTGHNLHGVLPPIEWSPQAVCWAWDAALAGGPTITNEQAAVLAANRQRHQLPDDEPVFALQSGRVGSVTRVVTRGDHRRFNDEPHRSLDERVSARWEVPYRFVGKVPVYNGKGLARWRRGELRQAARRREAARRRAAGPVPSTRTDVHSGVTS